MTGFFGGLRRSVRTLAGSPGFTVPAVTILAVGIAATTGIFTIVNGVLLEPLAFPESERLVMLCEDHARLQGACIASPPNVEDFRARSSTLSEAGIGRDWPFSRADAAGVLGVSGGLATGSFFEALGTTPEVGRLFRPDEVGPDRDKVVLLSHSLWTSRYGADPAVVGRTVALDSEPYEVVGVLPAGLEVPGLDYVQLWKPPHFDPLDESNRNWRGFRAIARLAPDATLLEAQTELRGIYGALRAEHEAINDEWRLRVQSLMDFVVGDVRATLLIFLGAVTLLMLIVCANVANLLLVRGARKGRELAVRAALGAGRGRLVADVLTESLTVSALGMAVGIVVAYWGTKLFMVVAPPGIPRLDEVALDLRVFGFAALVSLTSVVLFGLIPALRVTDLNLAAVLRGGGPRGGTGKNRSLRSGLVVTELALSMVLLVDAGLLARSFGEFLSWDPGFEREGLAAVSVFASPVKYETRADLMPLYRQTEGSLRNSPGVLGAATISSGPLFGGRESTTYVPDGEVLIDGQAAPTARYFDVGPGYFEMMGIRLVRGREFGQTDVLGAPPVAVVNETLAGSAFPGENPIGRTLHIPRRELTLEIVGVVADVAPITPGQAPDAEIYWPNRQFGRWGTFFVVRTAGDPTQMAAGIAQAIQQVDPDLTVGTVRPFEAIQARELVRPRFNALTVGVFALAALVLSAVGLYGVLAYSVAQRTREMGIRMALGLGRTALVREIVWDGLRLGAIGGAIGLVGAVASGRLLSSVVFGVAPTDPLTLLGTALLLLAIATMACIGPARRAGRMDLQLLLREE